MNTKTTTATTPCGTLGCTSPAWHAATSPRKRREAWRDPVAEVARFAKAVAHLDVDGPLTTSLVRPAKMCKLAVAVPDGAIPVDCSAAIACLMSDDVSLDA